MVIPGEPVVKIVETGIFGEDGWSISKRAPFHNSDD